MTRNMESGGKQKRMVRNHMNTIKHGMNFLEKMKNELLMK